MISVNEIAKSLNIKSSDIHNRIRKKKYQQHITKESKEKYLSKEGYDMLKKELKEFENIVEDMEQEVTIQTNNIDISILLKTIQEQQDTIKELISIISENNANLKREQLQNSRLSELYEKEISRRDSLLLKKNKKRQ